MPGDLSADGAEDVQTLSELANFHLLKIAGWEESGVQCGKHRIYLAGTPSIADKIEAVLARARGEVGSERC